MNSDLKLVFFIHKGEGISLCKHEPCVDVNVIRVRALQVTITAGFLFLLTTSDVNKSFHIFFNFSYFLLKYSYFAFSVV